MTDKENKTPDLLNQDQENQAKISNFMTEQIKQKPLNGRKLLRRTAITIAMAVIFGIVACVTFLFLQPIINRGMYPEEEVETIEFPEESSEMSPEDMLVADDKFQGKNEGDDQTSTVGDALLDNPDAETVPGTEGAGTDPEGDGEPGDGAGEGTAEGEYATPGTEKTPGEEGDPEDTAAEGDGPKEEAEVTYVREPLNTESIAELYASVSELAQQVNKSLVTVTSVTSDVNWFNDVYESSGQTTGLYIADNGRQLFFLVEGDVVQNADTIRVTFPTGFSVDATLQQIDGITSLAVVTCEKSEIKTSTLNEIQVASLGSSSAQDSLAVGSPVLAVGSPYGSSGTNAFGMITGTGSKLELPDSNYKLIRTDIYGSSYATGVLVNFQGDVLGIIDSSYNSPDTANLISAVGITELKRIMARLSNGKPRSYTGIYGTDVTNEIHLKQSIPFGAYVTRMDMSSPAMRAGIQSGDVITKINNRVVADYATYVDILYSYMPEDEVKVTIQRFTQDAYREMLVNMTIGTK
ncbi:MAG: PDZ domain-containing protein [Lachnospiraceae bacterium]|nr:PDZ domain-containing protein [Lachnospiraceae bacterium]